MRETGIVVETKGDSVAVQFNRTSMCAKCGACGIVKGQNSVVVSTKNTLGAKEGERVELEFAAKNALTSSLIAYMFPLALLLLGVWAGYAIPQSFFEVKDAFAAVLGILFAAVAFVVLKLLNPVFQRKFVNVYTMVRIDGKEE